MIKIFFFIAACLFAGTAVAAPAIDASGATTSNFNTSSAFVTIAVTTSSPNDLIVLDFYGVVYASPSAQISSVSGGGLTWSNRYQFLTHYPPHVTPPLDECAGGFTECWDNLERWTAPSTGTQSGTTITVNFSKNITYGVLIAYGVSGLGSLAAPYDPSFVTATNVINTASPFASTTPPPMAATISTTNANDLVLLSVASPWITSGDSFQPCPSPLFTFAGTDASSPARARMATEYRRFSAPITAQTYGFYNAASGASCAGAYAPFSLAADAMTGPAGVGSALFQTPINFISGERPRVVK